MDFVLIIPLLVSFFAVFLTLPNWIKRAKKAELEGKDMNKHEKTRVAEAGGVVVISGFVIGVLSYIALKTFYFGSDGETIKIFALLISVVILSFIGMIDDILGWKIGLDKRTRLFLVIMGAIPLMVISAGQNEINIPFFERISLGLLYPLLLIPLGIMGTSTTFNFLAGYNGLEAGQGIIIISSLSFVAYLTNTSWLALIGICMTFSLIAFLIFNRYPAKVFPGDVLTYPVGGMIAIMAVLGNMERIAIFFFIPYIIEVILKLRGRLKKESFGKPNKDNSLEMPYNKIYSLEHFAIWFLKKWKKDGKVYEKDVVHFIYIIQIAIILIGFIIFRKNIF